MFYLPEGPILPLEKASLRFIRRFQISPKHSEKVTNLQNRIQRFKTLNNSIQQQKNNNSTYNRPNRKDLALPGLPLIFERKFFLKGKHIGQSKDRKTPTKLHFKRKTQRIIKRENSKLVCLNLQNAGENFVKPWEDRMFDWVPSNDNSYF